MNTRLDNIYNETEVQNMAKFLSGDVIVDKNWGNKIFGVTIQIDLSEEVKSLLYKYQIELDVIEPNNLLFLPKKYQHISFNQVVYWGGDYKLGTKNTWDNISKEFMHSFNRLNNKYKAIEINFCNLVATTGGIILCAIDDNDVFENLRNELFCQISFLEETTKYNHIIHTTVARYSNKLSHSNELFKYIKSQKISTKMLVNKLVLREEHVFPSIGTKTLSTLSLV